MTDTAHRIAGLPDEELTALHARLDSRDPADPAVVQAHHLVTMELLKRGTEHGHADDDWSSSVVLVESVDVDGPDEIDAPEGFEKAWGESLASGGTVSVLLTVDGYVLKADPTSSDVHVDAVMGSGRRRRMEKTIREEGGKFVVYSEDGSRSFGTYDTRREAEERLAQIERFAKADDYRVPAGVQAAARQALKWIADGQAGSGFTSVGRGRARQLADGGTVSRATLVKMRAYFARHAVDKDAEGWGDKSDPTPGMVAWYAWGGDAGRSWANRVLGDVEKSAGSEEDFFLSLDDDELAFYGDVAFLLDHDGDPSLLVEKAGNPEALRDYWRGGGKGKVSWGAGGDFTACVAAVSKYMTEEQAKGYCAIRHREVNGFWPGDKRNRPAKKAAEFGTTAAVTPVTGTFTLPGGVTYTLDFAPSESLPAVKHLQGKHDQKSHAGGKGSTEVAVSQDVADSILERVREEGGLSVSMMDGSTPPDGFMVARTDGVKPAIVDADTFYDREAGTAALSSFLKDNREQLTGGDYLGIWEDSGKVFLDVSQNVKDRATAERLGRERDQISIWDVVQGEEIPTGGTGEIAKSDPSNRIAGSVNDDGRGDRRLRGGDLGEVLSEELEKHSPKGKPHDQKSHGRRKGGKTYELKDPPNPPAEAHRSPEAAASAKKIRDKVAGAEPKITSDIIDLADGHGATLEGLDFRMKSEKSLARKIDDEKHEKGGDTDATAESMSDVVRYTMTFPDREYVSGTEAVLKDAEERGYQVEKVKNYWGQGDPYQGINTVLVHPETGVRLELQFHTPTSLDFKEPKLSAGDPLMGEATHAKYERYRESKDMRTRYKEYMGMTRQAAQIPTPPPPDKLLAIGELRTQDLQTPEGQVIPLP